MGLVLLHICLAGELKVGHWTPEEPVDNVLTLQDPPFSIPLVDNLCPILRSLISEYSKGMKSVYVRVRGETSLFIAPWMDLMDVSQGFKYTWCISAISVSGQTSTSYTSTSE